MALIENIAIIALAAIPIFILLGLGMNEDTKSREPKKKAEYLPLLYPDDDNYEVLVEEHLEELDTLRAEWFRFVVRSKIMRGISHGLVFPLLLLTPMFYSEAYSIPVAILSFVIVFALYGPVDIYLTSRGYIFWKDQRDLLGHIVDILEQLIEQDEYMRGAYLDGDEVDIQEYLVFEIMNFIENRGLVGTERTQFLDYLAGMNPTFAESVIITYQNYRESEENLQ
ncbi:MAG: hypothetical protein RTU92_05420 [Candidatus Thorarchaeota archaeon]